MCWDLQKVLLGLLLRHQNGKRLKIARFIALVFQQDCGAEQLETVFVSLFLVRKDHQLNLELGKIACLGELVSHLPKRKIK
ncbi:hypothetical protein N8482_01860 [Chitinophagales bacterium]|nr:hypothetical protein [Chitinophagales bacterium]